VAYTLRTAGPEDVGQIAEVLHEGFVGYRAFAPPDWEPPDPRTNLDALRERLSSPDVWCLLAEENGAPAGHISVMPAVKHDSFPSTDPALAHLWQLFVRPPWQGTGLATTLHAEALRETGARGFSAIRLYTPAAQVRARRFYEREGWATAGPPIEDTDFGLPLVEYRRAISISV